MMLLISCAAVAEQPPWISYILSAARVINELTQTLTPRKNLLPMGVSAKWA
jgi:hypothetical protein